MINLNTENMLPLLTEWLLNLEKYSKIKAYKLNGESVGKIWDTVGGSMWEIQEILVELFDKPINNVLNLYKRKIKGMIKYYIWMDIHKEKILEVFLKKEAADIKDFASLGIATTSWMGFYRIWCVIIYFILILRKQYIIPGEKLSMGNPSLF